MIGKDYIWKKDRGMNFYPISEGGGDFLSSPSSSLLCYCPEISLNNKNYFWNQDMSEKCLGGEPRFPRALFLSQVFKYSGQHFKKNFFFFFLKAIYTVSCSSISSCTPLAPWRGNTALPEAPCFCASGCSLPSRWVKGLRSDTFPAVLF